MNLASHFPQEPTLDLSQKDIVGSGPASVKGIEIIQYFIKKSDMVVPSLDAATPGISHYLWNTGDTTRSIFSNTSGMYFVILGVIVASYMVVAEVAKGIFYKVVKF